MAKQIPNKVNNGNTRTVCEILDVHDVVVVSLLLSLLLTSLLTLFLLYC